MFCPNCGANNSTEQNFCRACGLNLEDAARSLLAQIPSAEQAQLLRHEKAIERFGNFALGGLGVVGATAGIWFLVTKLLVGGMSFWMALLFVGFIVFAFLSLIFVILNESLKEKKTKLKASEIPGINEISRPNTTGRFLEEKPFEAVPSIVESSTELFPVENKTRKFE